MHPAQKENHDPEDRRVLHRHCAITLIVLFCLISVSRATLVPEDVSLKLSAERLAGKDYPGAYDAALQALPGPKRDLVVGIAAYRLEKWDEAEQSLATVADRFRLLGDFALYYRAKSLVRLDRLEEVFPLLDRLKRDYAESPLLRAAHALYADTLFQKGDWQAALDSYQQFITRYASGNDTLKAAFNTALCREKLGDTDGAVRDLRNIWLSYPSKAVADDAEAALARIRSSGASVPPYSAEELFRRGNTLFDQRQYRQASAMYASLEPGALPERLRGKLAFRSAMSLFRAKRNSEAGEALARLASPESPYREYAVESSYWYAQLLDRIGKDHDAIAAFLALAESQPKSELADDALLQAALISRHAGEHHEARAMFRKLIAAYPTSPHASRAMWETAWSLYSSGDYPGAADTFSLVINNATYREKALYWLARSQEESGLQDAARTTYTILREEYPSGFYVLNFEKQHGMQTNRVPSLDKTILASLNFPQGFDRVKALIALGLRDEAAMELAACRKRNSSSFRGSTEHAALYLAMEDYRSAMGLFQQSSLLQNAPLAWAILYPTAFHDAVSRHALRSSVDESLTFALIRAESTFSATVRSPVGAVGLMQLMPATAQETAKNMGETVTVSKLTHPETNIRIGTRHLKDLITRFNGNLVSAVAAYNAGSTPVIRWRKKFGSLREEEFIENIPYPETREYVKKVLAGMEIYRRLYRYNEPAPLLSAEFPASQNRYSSSQAQTARQ